MDILPMYFVFMLVLPLVNQQFQRGHYWKVFLISLTVWAASQLGLKNRLTELVFDDLPVYLGYFDVLGYQVLFIAGAFIRYKLHTNSAQLHCIYKPQFLFVAVGVAVFLLLVALSSYPFIYSRVSKADYQTKSWPPTPP
jgi:hypothetical protein